ncbi:transposase [Fusobacterium animalis ATCC 51191]|uniref:Transposase n=1 Tax=Fusobacterium animalis ATCC 51191 TaxID=997347 RepID=F9EK50_9FUSO|nr:transposase [Fusobacterium animalis ATCC 51191]
MRDNVDIFRKVYRKFSSKKNLLQTTVEAYKFDINEYLKFLKGKNIDILDTDENIFNEYFSNIEKKL